MSSTRDPMCTSGGAMTKKSDKLKKDLERARKAEQQAKQAYLSAEEQLTEMEARERREAERRAAWRERVSSGRR